MTHPTLLQLLERTLQYLPPRRDIDWSSTSAARWQVDRWASSLAPLSIADGIGVQDLLHIDAQKQALVSNTQQFLAGLPANHALLWGARGTGKSSLVHALLHEHHAQGLRLVEVRRQDLTDLPQILQTLHAEPYRFIVFCDDLSFEQGDEGYKALKSALEGSIFKVTSNVLIYATSNRRHLLPEHMSDNQNAQMVDGELHLGDAVEEKISLSDRFGLWLSFYPFRQEDYLVLVRHWVAKLAAKHGIQISPEDEQLRAEALRWALARGVRSGRTAEHFARHWVGQTGLSTFKD